MHVVAIVVVVIRRQSTVVSAEGVRGKSSHLVVPNLLILMILVRVEWKSQDFPHSSVFARSDWI